MSIVFLVVANLLPGDFLKYNMYSKDTAIINDIHIFKKGKKETVLLDELNSFLYHRKIIDEAHPIIDYVGLKMFLKKYIDKNQIDSIHFYIDNNKISIK